jgi:PHD/YefM family antitoxin component YafN of YafNO toxin-antitoxin module
MSRPARHENGEPRRLAAIQSEHLEEVRLDEHPRPLFGINATDAKNKFGLVLDHVPIRPVVVIRNDRPVAIVVSPEEFVGLLRALDQVIAEKLEAAEAAVFLGTTESARVLADLKARQDS